MKKHILIFAVASFIGMSSAHAFDIGSAIGTAVTGVQKVAEASKDITPSEEHYIGRTVAAMVISRYPLVEDAALTEYLNKVGLLVAYSSERQETYGGYHFAAVKDNAVNAYACPGGFIFVTTGLLNEAINEDQLAAILGHEVAHVAHRDGINAIKKSRWTNLGFYAAGEAAGRFSPAEVKDLTNVFTGVISEVAKTVIEKGYSQSDERKADEAGVRYTSAAGYDPSGLIALLESEIQKGLVSSGGPFSSHPKAENRVKALKAEIEQGGLGREIASVRTDRFKQTVASR